MDSIYGQYAPQLVVIAEEMRSRIEAAAREEATLQGHTVVEHVRMRVKSEESMREKCRRLSLPETPESALLEIHDAIGVRVVTRFVDDIGRIAARIRTLPGVSVYTEKDYVSQAKSNGYRSYHMVLIVASMYRDVLERSPGLWYCEVQLRTIAMDTWAALEHELSYKQDVVDSRIIAAELKRVADELASCDLSMQTLRTIIRGKPIPPLTSDSSFSVKYENEK